MSPRTDCRHAGPRRAGFTLMELIVVIAVIATLAAVVGPSIFRSAGDAKSSAAQSQVEVFALALNAFRLDNDNFPTTEQGLYALRTEPAGGEPLRNWRGPYVSKEIGPDPWGRPWLYLSPGMANPQSFDLYSLGRDGRVGGVGEDADITSWTGAVVQ